MGWYHRRVQEPPPKEDDQRRPSLNADNRRLVLFLFDSPVYLLFLLTIEKQPSAINGLA